MGLADVIFVDQTMEDPMRRGRPTPRGFVGRLLSGLSVDVIVVLVSCCVFLPLVASPPHLMDDVDAVQAQIARNMLQSGDWVTARLNGITYLEKSPLKYWLIAIFFKLFGVHDWVARLPIALAAVGVCWLTARAGSWAFSET